MKKTSDDVHIESESAAFNYRTFDERELNLDSNGQQVTTLENISISVPLPNTQEHFSTKDKSVKQLVHSKLYTTDIAECRKEWTLCTFSELPIWMQDNHYLITSHRPHIPNVAACFKSIFYMHTETLNIWTHLLGCIVFVILALIYFTNQPTLEERLAFTPYFIGSISCLGFSSMFHTLNCHSATTAKLFNRLDYCGISLLIMGTFTSWIYYTFYCYFWLRIFYISTSSMLGICTVGFTLLSNLTDPSFRMIRVILFTSFGFSGLIPVFHIMAIKDWDMTMSPGTPYIITSSILYNVGAVVYTLRIPEKLAPGRYDIWFHSHQIFHTLAVFAALFEYQGIIGVYKESSTTECEL